MVCFLLPVGFTMVTMGICYGRLLIHNGISVQRVYFWFLYWELIFLLLQWVFDFTVGNSSAVGFRILSKYRGGSLLQQVVVVPWVIFYCGVSTCSRKRLLFRGFRSLQGLFG